MASLTTPVSNADPSRELEARKNKLRENCKEFESVMIGYMMKTMHDGVRWGEEPDTAREVYEDMLTQQIAKEVGRSSKMGIGDLLYSKLEPRIEAEAGRKNPQAHAGASGYSLNKLENSADK